MRLKLLCVCLAFICAFCTSCGSAEVFTTRYTENDRIDAQLREQMHGLSQDAIDCIQADDPASLLELMVDEASQNNDTRQQTEQMVHQFSGTIKDLDFGHEADYYWERSGSSDAPCLILASSQNPFRIEIEGVSDRMFISLLRSEDAFNRYLVGMAWAESMVSGSSTTFRPAQWRSPGKMPSIGMRRRRPSTIKGTWCRPC